jgi:hypothetical protein
MIAREHGDRIGDNRKSRYRAFQAVLAREGLAWVAESRSTGIHLLHEHSPFRDALESMVRRLLRGRL